MKLNFALNVGIKNDMVLEEYKKELILIKQTQGYYDKKTGKYIEGKEDNINFEGAILPLNDNDLKILEAGAYTQEDCKLYTNISIKNNSYITDTTDNKIYKITAVREYNLIDNNFKRYIIKKVDKIDG